MCPTARRRQQLVALVLEYATGGSSTRHAIPKTTCAKHDNTREQTQTYSFFQRPAFRSSETRSRRPGRRRRSSRLRQFLSKQMTCRSAVSPSVTSTRLTLPETGAVTKDSICPERSAISKQRREFGQSSPSSRSSLDGVHLRLVS
jgi:hypothetical protein